MKRRTLVVLTGVGALLLSWFTLAAQAPTAAERMARIEARLLPGIVVKNRPAPLMALADRMRFHQTPGLSVAVINDGAVEWAKGYGVVEAGSRVPVTPHTRFQAASISKPVAALAALRLVGDGRLSLDEDVNLRLTSWKVPATELTATDKVTVRRLLTHTAGLTVSGFPGYGAQDPLPSLLQVLDGAKPANTVPIRVDARPGSTWRYSGGGYTVLQQLLIDIGGRPFPEFMRETVLQPLHMDDSSYEQRLPGTVPLATAHDRNGQPLPGRHHVYPEMAAAGLWTTPTDLAKFAIEIRRALTGTSPVLSASLAKEMLTAGLGSWGLGLSIEGMGSGARFGHGGSNAGFKCQMLVYIEKGHGAVVMTNGDGGGRLAAEVVRTIAMEYEWPFYPRPREKAVVALSPSTLARYSGRYELRPGREIEITQHEGRLTLVDRDQRIELLPESETRFFELTEERQLDFQIGPDGVVTGFLVDGQMKVRKMPPAR